jgi:deoxyribodipyrimidine photolyase-related protein
MATYHTLRLILGDQLNHQHPWFQENDPGTLYVLMETRSETDYVAHHIQKVCAFFLAMRAFAADLQAAGHAVYYIKLNEAGNTQSISENLQLIVAATGARRFEYQLPDEYRLDKMLREFCINSGLAYGVYDTEHFLTHRDELAHFFAGKKQWLMETFYRSMRQRLNVLMEDGQPLGNRWNFDMENRGAMPAGVKVNEAPRFEQPCAAIISMLNEAGVKTIGRVQNSQINWPINRAEALTWLAFFVTELLPHFGRYQDALADGQPFLFHSRLSFALNVKLLHPREVISAAEEAYRQNPAQYPLPAVEGFIRQILGWREYMRGIYWAYIPGYRHMNYFNHNRPLPAWFWTGETRMRCMAQAIGQSLDHAYAHHIQRLMVIGNFALLAGCSPDALDEWYLGIYIDAVEWVEMPNTRGMSQYADGGIVGSKPYVASANYIHQTGDHCKNCVYHPKRKTAADACPFNSLYWHFYDRHRDKLENHPRIGMVYRNWDKQKQQNEILAKAESILANLDAL